MYFRSPIKLIGRLFPDMYLVFFDANHDITVWLIKSGDVPFCSITSVQAAVHSKQVCSKTCMYFLYLHDSSAMFLHINNWSQSLCKIQLEAWLGLLQPMQDSTLKLQSQLQCPMFQYFKEIWGRFFYILPQLWKCHEGCWWLPFDNNQWLTLPYTSYVKVEGNIRNHALRNQ